MVSFNKTFFNYKFIFIFIYFFMRIICFFNSHCYLYWHYDRRTIHIRQGSYSNSQRVSTSRSLFVTRGRGTVAFARNAESPFDLKTKALPFALPLCNELVACRLRQLCGCLATRKARFPSLTTTAKDLSYSSMLLAVITDFLFPYLCGIIYENRIIFNVNILLCTEGQLKVGYLRKYTMRVKSFFRLRVFF